MSAQSFVADIVRYFIGWWWLAAAAGKLRTWPGFRDELGTSFGIAAQPAALLAPALVTAELLAAAMVLGIAHAAGMLASLLLMCCFTSVLGYQFFTRAIVRCNCFGESRRPLSGHDLLRNLLVVLAIAAWLLLRSPAAPLPGGESLVAAGLGAWLCVAAIHFHDIAVLARTR
jgi:hypothetical protein